MAEIAFIAPYKGLAELAERVAGGQIDIRTGRIKVGVRLAKDAVAKGAKVVISRGITAWLIGGSGLGVPVIDVPITGYDLLRGYFQARKIGHPVGILDVPEVLSGVSTLEDILGERIIQVPLLNQAQVEQGIVRLKELGAKVVMGKIAMAKLAEKRGMRGIIIESGEEAVRQALAEARRMLDFMKIDRQSAERIKAIVDCSYDGVIAVDSEGMITVFNSVAERITGIRASQAIGRNAAVLFPDSRVNVVLENGQNALGAIHELGAARVAANYVPVMVDGKVQGAVLTFQEVGEVQETERKIRVQSAAKGHVAKYSFGDITGSSVILAQTLEKAKKFAAVGSTVLIQGETGVGKEMLASAIHRASDYRRGPFVAVNCAALPESLLESELFGYVEGAFTGARKGGKPGLFELAHGGSIFLDEISEMSERLQARVLRVIQEHEVMRLGDDRVIPVDVRVIAATNKDLWELVKARQFRPDLYYRLNVLNIAMPPLRQRKEDIPVLADSFVRDFARRFRKTIAGLEQEAVQALLDHDWPGNIRELQNVIERACILTDTPIISRALITQCMGAAVPEEGEQSRGTKGTETRRGRKRRTIDRAAILDALAKTGQNRTEAAKLLGIGRTTLWRKLK